MTLGLAGGDARIAELVRAGVGAVLAGARLAEGARNPEVVAQKGSLRDIVTRVDLEIQDEMLRHLRATGAPVVSEERPETADVPGACWVIDPIDGTVNFAHGLPQYAISAGWVEAGACQLGAVCIPALNELYFTLHPDRALLNGKPIQHAHLPVEASLVAMGFGARAADSQYALFREANESTRGCLRTGSAAVNLCWTATRRGLQAAIGFDAKLWDVAGGLAVARAAGCAVHIRRHADPFTVDYCAGSHDVVEHLLGLARAHGLWS